MRASSACAELRGRPRLGRNGDRRDAACSNTLYHDRFVHPQSVLPSPRLLLAHGLPQEHRQEGGPSRAVVVAADGEALTMDPLICVFDTGVWADPRYRRGSLVSLDAIHQRDAKSAPAAGRLRGRLLRDLPG